MSIVTVFKKGIKIGTKANSTDLSLRAAKTEAKIHRVDVDKDKGETTITEEFVTGTPDEVKRLASPTKQGQKVELEHIHTTKVYDGETHTATNSGVVKQRVTKVFQSYDFGDSGTKPATEPGDTVSDEHYNPTISEPTNTDQCCTQSNDRDSPIGDHRMLKNMCKNSTALGILAIAIAVVAVIVAFMA